MKNTKKSLLISILSLMLCFAMLIGTTYAWFTDSVTSGKNKIIAGNLDVELTHTNAKVTTPESVQDSTDLFGVSLWEPGVIAWENFTITNVGNLALHYALNLNVFDKNATTAGHDLTEVIKAVVVPNGFNPTGTTPEEKRAEAQELPFGTLADFQETGNLVGKTSTETDSDTFGVVLYWEPTDHDNDYNLQNGKTSTDGLPLFVEFGVNVIATQLEHESDSFDNQYDKFADLWKLSTVTPDGRWVGITKGETCILEGTLDPYITVVGADGQPGEIIALTNELDRSVGSGNIKVSGNTVTYTNSGAAQNVVIRTNSASTELVVNAEHDTVKHFDSVGTVHIIAVDSEHCYEENGKAAFTQMDSGKYKTTANADVELLYVSDATAVTVEATPGTVDHAHAYDEKEATQMNGGTFEETIYEAKASGITFDYDENAHQNDRVDVYHHVSESDAEGLAEGQEIAPQMGFEKPAQDATEEQIKATFDHNKALEEVKTVVEEAIIKDMPSDAEVYILETKVPYMSLQKGLDAAEDNQTIVFLKDIDITNSSYQFQIKVDHTNIDLAKHTLTLHTTVNLAKKDGKNWVPVTVNMKNGTIINDHLITGLRYETGSSGTYEKVTFKAINRDWSTSGSAGGHYSQSSAIQVYANNQTGSYEKNTYSFKDCVFAETTLELGGGSGSCNNYDVTVEGCTFTLTDTSSASGINVNHYEYGSIVVNNSIFNINPVPGDGNAYGIYTQSNPSDTKNNYLHVYLSGNTFTCTNKAEPYEQRNSYSMSGSYSEATTFHDDGTNTYKMNNITVSHYKTDSSNNLWREGTSSGSWDYRWTSSARYAVLEACEDEYNLFRTTSSSGYKNGDMYLVQKDEGYFVASGTTINPIQYSWPTIDENDVVDYGGSYYDKSKVVYTTDLTSGLTGGNDDVKIYKLNGMTLLKFSDGKTTTDIGYVDSTEGYVYQCVYEAGKQYDTTVNGLTKDTDYTVDETGKITVNAGAFNQKRNATIYNKQKYTWTASGSATGSGTYYAGTATTSFSVTTPQSAGLYKVTSVQIGGVEADPSKYYIKNDPKYSTFYVCFDNAATDITGNVTFTIAPISENLVAEVSAFKNDTTKYNNKLSYLFVEGEKVYIFNAGTSNMVFYTGSVTDPASTSAYTNTVTKTGDDVYFDYASSSTSKYNYKLGEKLVDQNGVQIYALNNVLKLVYSNVYYFGEDFTITYGEKKEFTIPDFDVNKHYELFGDNISIATLDASTGKITIDTTLFTGFMYSKNTFSLGYRECYTITAVGDVVGVGSKTTPSVTTKMNTAISSKNIYVTGDTNSYNITVTVGGVALASNQYTATWNNNLKCYKLTINAQYVTGDIVVTATAK